MKNLLLLVLPVLFFSCLNHTLRVQTELMTQAMESIPDSERILTLSLYEDLPEGSQFIGKLEAGGLLHPGAPCSHNLIMAEFERNAREMGANLIKVTKPRLNTPCPRVAVGMFRNDDQQALAAILEQREVLNDSSLPPDADYAEVHFYRTGGRTGPIGRVRVIEEGREIGRLGRDEKFTYRVYREDRQSFRLGRSLTLVELDIKLGEEYYLTFSPRTDFLEHKRVELRRVDNLVGREDFKSLDSKARKGELTER
jgi:hypothetical protein